MCDLTMWTFWIYDKRDTKKIQKCEFRLTVDGYRSWINIKQKEKLLKPKLNLKKYEKIIVYKHCIKIRVYCLSSL